MKVIDITLGQLKEAPWNANVMDEAMMMHLRESVRRYGLVEPLVVRRLPDGHYEVLSGNQRLKLLTGLGVASAPCVVVDLGDIQARLLAQALNHIRGEDDLGLRAELLREVLKVVPDADVLKVLPDSAEGLRSLAAMGQQTVAEYLRNWQQAQGAKLKSMAFRLTPGQVEVVEEAFSRLLPRARQDLGDSPNARGVALYLLCKSYLEKEGRQ